MRKEQQLAFQENSQARRRDSWPRVTGAGTVHDKGQQNRCRVWWVRKGLCGVCPEKRKCLSKEMAHTKQEGPRGPGLRHSAEKVDEADRARAEVWDGARAMQPGVSLIDNLRTHPPPHVHRGCGRAGTQA